MPHNTISIVVREVCQAIIDEYIDEVMTCPITPDGWREIPDCFYQKWIESSDDDGLDLDLSDSFKAKESGGVGGLALGAASRASGLGLLLLTDREDDPSSATDEACLPDGFLFFVLFLDLGAML